MRLRDVMPDDEPFLWLMLTYAASMTPGGLASVEAAQQDPGLCSYVEGWPRPGDLGVIGETEAGEPLGAAWVRLLEGAPHPHKVATREIPELAIGVAPEHRGRGLGARLLDELVVRATGRYPALILSVREANPSVRLYKRAGFEVEQTIVNRVGGNSLVMRRSLPR
jgi:ribosomal protein S18 acetylase RimI-like enzyme